MTRRSSFLVAWLVLATTSPVAAQLRGVVRDGEGRPLADAVIDLWTSSTRIARQVTSTDGRFSFRASEGVVRLTARRIGSRPIVRVLFPADSVMAIVLTAVPVNVEELRVEGGRCASREDREARSRWESAAARYRFPAETLWLSSEVKVVHERVPVEQINHPVADSTGFGWTAGTRFGMMQRWWELRLGRSGFVALDPDAAPDGAQLFGLHHHYWVSAAFGASMRLSMVDPSTIRFCPRDRGKPWIEGEIGLADDGTLLWVRWRYGADRPILATGGMALFLAPTATADLPLLPSAETAWQERLRGTAAQWTREYREWKVTTTEPVWPEQSGSTE